MQTHETIKGAFDEPEISEARIAATFYSQVGITNETLTSHLKV